MAIKSPSSALIEAQYDWLVDWIPAADSAT
jgi:hypothetical protein